MAGAPPCGHACLLRCFIGMTHVKALWKFLGLLMLSR